VNSTKIIQLLLFLALLSSLFLPSTAVSENSNVVPPLSLLLLGGIHYSEVTSATGEIWLDRNLGASRVAESSTDSEAYGDLYQWGRLTDGHQNRLSLATEAEDLSSEDVPGHGDFIKAPPPYYDWRTPQNNSLWQGVSGTNNPCPSGFRLPTATEFDAERISWVEDNGSTNDSVGAFASSLKLVMAGFRNHYAGEIEEVGIRGAYWSSTSVLFAILPNAYRSNDLYFNSTSASVNTEVRALGFSIRCLKD